MAHASCEPLRQGTILADLQTTLNGPVIWAKTSTGSIRVEIEHDHPVITSETQERRQVLSVEDVTTITDGQWHSIALTVGEEGTRFYVDGYLAFCGTATTFLGSIGASSIEWADQGMRVQGVTVLDRILNDTEVLAESLPPHALTQFAGNQLEQYDIQRVAKLVDGTIFLRFRLHGAGYSGAILSAGDAATERLRVNISPDGLTHEVLTGEGQWRTWRVEGDWADANWHDVAVRVGEGATDIYVDGYRQAHLAGQAFFADTEPIDRVTIGQTIFKKRLFGTVSKALIYPTPLTDGQIKRLSNVTPVPTRALFDSGYENSCSYRIPSLLALPSNVVVAGADQRVSSGQDSPNDINFVIRRSLDGGETWGPLQTIIEYPGTGQNAASVIDSCLLYDRQTQTLHCMIDHFPGGVGLPNSGHGTGMDAEGHFVLTDKNNERYVLLDDGTVTTETGEETDYRVSSSGDVTYAGQYAGNIYLKDGDDPQQSLLTARTSYLIHLVSTDDGETWSEPVHLNSQVKAEWMAFLGVSPGTGVQLADGSNRGRLVMPIYYSGDNVYHLSTAVVYSDDHGETWHRGASVNDGRVFKGETISSRSFTDREAATLESTLVELSGGRILILMRNPHPCGRVAWAISEDGGDSWSDVQYHPQLPEIFSQPNAITLATQTGPAIVFANASQLMPYRGNGVLRVSFDEGKTWPLRRTFNPGHYVYQSMTELPDGSIGLLWEHEWQGLYFSRLPRSWFGSPLLTAP